jgi:N utilization substance protein A
MAKFVDSVEKRATVKKAPEKKAEDKQRQEVRKTIAPVAFEQNILDSALPEHMAYTLQENGYPTIGDLILQMKIDQDEILRLQGIGPRAMNEIARLVDALSVQPAAATAEAATAEAATAEAEAVEAATVETETAEAATATATAAAPEAEKAGGFENVVAGQVEEIVERAAEDSAVADEVTIAPTSPVQAEAESEEVTFDELFTMRPEVVADAPAEEEEEDSKDKKKGKKKGKKHVEIVFDPDAGQTFAKKKHKRGGEEWEW